MSTRLNTLAGSLAAATSTAALAVLATIPASAGSSATAQVADQERTTADSRELREIQSPGFLLVDGRYTTIQVPGSRTHTYAHGINDRGLIAGGFDNPSFDGPDGRGHAMVLRRDGSLLRFDVGGAVATLANKINDRGQVVGGFNLTDISVGVPETKGFLRGPRGLRVIDVPGSIETQALGVNNLGVVVGEYVDANGVFHGFRWKRGRFTTIDGPGALGGAVFDINDRGQMVGAFFTKSGGARGFILRNGSYRTLNAPYGPIDLPSDINNRGRSWDSPSATREEHRAMASCCAGASVDPSPESTSQGRQRPWCAESTIAAASSASTATRMRHRQREALRRRRWRCRSDSPRSGRPDRHGRADGYLSR